MKCNKIVINHFYATSFLKFGRMRNIDCADVTVHLPMVKGKWSEYGDGVKDAHFIGWVYIVRPMENACFYTAKLVPALREADQEFPIDCCLYLEQKEIKCDI
jgi:hypothetical protein